MVAGLRGTFEQSAALISACCSQEYLAAVAGAVDAIVKAFQSGNKLLVFGNGGSAADAQHICAELVGRFAADRPGLPAIALTTDQAFLTAWSNDHGFEAIFDRQIQALGRPGDVAWGLSTSGDSANVVNALRTARASGLVTIGMTGAGGGRAAAHSDHLICAPSRETPRIQEVHAVTYHAICGAVETGMFVDTMARPVSSKNSNL